MSPHRRPPEGGDGYDIRVLTLQRDAEREKRAIELEEIQQALREELRDWLNEQFVLFGKWTLKGLLALLFAGLIYAIIVTHGFRPS